MDSGIILKRKDSIITADMRGSAVTMDVNTGKYYNLGETGGFIWNCMKEEISYGRLIEKISEEYGITAKECEQDVEKFVKKLIDDGLVSVK